MKMGEDKAAIPAKALAKAGAEGRTRTDMVLPPRDFESRASAISPLRHIYQFQIYAQNTEKPRIRQIKKNFYLRHIDYFFRKPINESTTPSCIVKPSQSRSFF
jgi:hypothetical protein